MIELNTPSIGQEEIDAVVEVLRSGQLAQGSKVEEFEQSFAGFIGTKYAVAVSSGSAALYLSLLAHGIGKGDEVITSPLSFLSTATSIIRAGAKPVFVDVEPDYMCIDPKLIGAAITKRTKAIIPVHIYGQPCDMDAIVNMAAKNGLSIIEDACQAHGAEYRGEKVGCFGTGCFSFYPTKNMTCGEGGMVTTNDGRIADRIRKLRNHEYAETWGFNWRMTDIQAAIGLVQLRKLPGFNAERRELAKLYSEIIPLATKLCIPKERAGCRHVYQQYALRVNISELRNTIVSTFAELGIRSRVYYRQPLHRLLETGGSFPVAERVCDTVFSLPVQPRLSGEDAKRMIGSIIEVAWKLRP